MYKIWMTQGQGCGEHPDAECATLEEILEEARQFWGDGCFGIECPDGSWYVPLGSEWRMTPKITLLQLNEGPYNPRQQYLLKKLESIRFMKSALRGLRESAMSFQDVLSSMEGIVEDCKVARRLFLECLSWGLFKTVEWNSGSAYPRRNVDKTQ